MSKKLVAPGSHLDIPRSEMMTSSDEARATRQQYLSTEQVQFTPGPWKAVHEPAHEYASVTDNGGYRIDAPADNVTQLAFVWVLNHRLPADGSPQETGPRFGDVRAAANARLIAAAPDMFEALEAIFDAATNKPIGELITIALHRSKAALSKARDGSPSTEERTTSTEGIVPGGPNA